MLPPEVDLTAVASESFPHGRAVLGGLNQGVLVVDAEGQVVDATAPAIGLCREPPIGRLIGDVTYRSAPDVTVVDLPDGASAVILTPESPEQVALKGILEQIPASVARLSRDLRIEQVSNLWLLATGLEREAVTGRHLHDLGLPARVRNDLEPLVARVLETGQPARLETLIPTTVGLRWVEFVFVAERNRDAEITHVIGVSSDITHRKNRELSLSKEAMTDPLTGLLNRSGLNDAFRRRADQPGWSETTLLLIDLDDFKRVNDRHGHLVGDAVLVEVAARLRGAVEEQIPVARLGGDEFVVLGSRAGDGSALAAAIQAAFATPVETATEAFAIHLSIGIATVTSADEDVSQLFNRADEAMYRAKRTGSGLERDPAPEGT